MRVELCAIAKNEHNYINEWVKHYLKLGFDKITIYDNDNLSAPFIGDYIDKEFLPKINIINVRGIHKHCFQHECYQDFYKNNKFDWCLFCDIDEFLVGVDNIKDFLGRHYFKYFDQIRVKWLLFGDDDLITRDMNKGVYGSFKKPILNNRLSNQSKSFIRGCLNIEIHSCHFNPSLPSCLPNGERTQTLKIELDNYQNQTIYMFHYMTKTLSEFINQKLNRSDAVWEKRAINLDYFWRINRKTQEKMKYLKDMGLI